MALKISDVTVVDNNRRGTFQSLFPGQYETGGEPASPVAGDIIWDTTEGELRVYNGTSWDSV